MFTFPSSVILPFFRDRFSSKWNRAKLAVNLKLFLFEVDASIFRIAVSFGNSNIISCSSLSFKPPEISKVWFYASKINKICQTLETLNSYFASDNITCAFFVARGICICTCVNMYTLQN